MCGVASFPSVRNSEAPLEINSRFNLSFQSLFPATPLTPFPDQTVSEIDALGLVVVLNAQETSQTSTQTTLSWIYALFGPQQGDRR